MWIIPDHFIDVEKSNHVILWEDLYKVLGTILRHIITLNKEITNSKGDNNFISF